MTAAPSAVAEEVTKNICQEIGHASPKNLSDRDGHAIDIVSASCRVESGPMDGGILTAQCIWEWDKTIGVLIFGGGVVRKGGAPLSYISRRKEKLRSHGGRQSDWLDKLRKGPLGGCKRQHSGLGWQVLHLGVKAHWRWAI